MSELFTPYKIGPIELKNRTIRSAAFEAMCPGQRPSEELFNYHTAVARGGIGMTTVAYAAVCQSGLSFENQLWMREEIVPELKKLTDAIHAEGAKASIQLGHCGNMSQKHLRMYAIRCEPRIQPLLPYLRPEDEHGADQRGCGCIWTCCGACN